MSSSPNFHRSIELENPLQTSQRKRDHSTPPNKPVKFIQDGHGSSLLEKMSDLFPPVVLEECHGPRPRHGRARSFPAIFPIAPLIRKELSVLINASATIKRCMLGNREDSSRNHNPRPDGRLTDYYLQSHTAGKSEKSGKRNGMSRSGSCLGMPDPTSGGWQHRVANP